jgi:hypothetical protein
VGITFHNLPAAIKGTSVTTDGMLKNVKVRGRSMQMAEE